MRALPDKLKYYNDENDFKLLTPSIVIPLSFKLRSYRSRNWEVIKAFTPLSLILLSEIYRDFKLVKVSQEAMILHPIGPNLLWSINGWMYT